MNTDWEKSVRLCLVNLAIGGLAALPVNLFNRLMTVELALPALLPGLLVALHYAIQITRPVWGHKSDKQGARTPFILGGVAVVGAGLIMAAFGISLGETNFQLALILWVLAYILIGAGIGAAGTSFLALLANTAPADSRGAVATLAWVFLIIGAIAGSIGTGMALEPYSPARLIVVVTFVSVIALVLSFLATLKIENALKPAPPSPHEALMPALRAVWADHAARQFTGFVFLSILAFYLSELIFEPFAGHVHGLSPEESTKLSGGKDGAALIGMIAAGVLSTFHYGSLRAWAVAGCFVSAAGLLALGAGLPLVPATLCLGFGNGLFVVGAIGSMMSLAAEQHGTTGTRMGVFGAAQAIAAGIAGLIATGTLDLARLVMSDQSAYASVFALEAFLFILAAFVALKILDRKAYSPAAYPGE